MQPAPVGTRIRVIRNEANHSYRIGGIYNVRHVDDDGTFRATDAAGSCGNWLRWSECEPVGGASWAEIAADMPEPLVRFLSCFDGIGEILLKESVIDAVLETLPDLHERVLAVAGTPAGEAAIAANRPHRADKPAGATGAQPARRPKQK